MKIAAISIRRPVFTTMVMMAIMAFGAIMYARLPVDLFPEVDFPVVTVTTVYPGADPETMEGNVTDRIEEALNSLGGVEALRSTSLESVSMVVVQFELGVDLEVAAQDVRDRVASVVADLPDGAEVPVVEKLDLGASPVLQVAVHGPIDPTALARWTEEVARPRLERVAGVGTLSILGGREREIQVYLDPERLRALGLTVLEVNQALGAQNLDIPGGRLGDSVLEQTLRTSVEAESVDQLRDIVIASRGDRPILLSDIAQVVDGLEEERSRAMLNGQAAIGLVIQKVSGANTVAVVDALGGALDELRAIAPEGVALDVIADNSRQIRGSLAAVQFDLLLGAFLAVAIILLFLRDFRATVISALALPTSVLGTFVFVSVMGFSLNLMTTLALSLSIGILIDDAIVVIENIVRRRTELGEGATDAAFRGTSEIGLAVLATTLSIVAVFVPVAFMDGMVGQFFYEFGLTVAAAVLISLFVSFTMTPMLSARWLGDHAGEHRGVSRWIEVVLRGIERTYRGSIALALRFWPVTMAAAIATLVVTLGAAKSISFEFMPLEDSEQFSVSIELPVGTALDRTAEVAEEMAAQIRALPGVALTFATVGGGVEEKVNTASITVNLIGRELRAYHQSEIMARVREMLSDDSDVLVSVGEVSPVASGGRQEPVQIGLSGDDMVALGETAERLAERLAEQPGFVDVSTNYRTGKPEVAVVVDAVRAADLGVSGTAVGATVRALVAGEIATHLALDGDRIDVRVQLAPSDLQNAEVVARAQVRSAEGQTVEIDAIADVRESTGPTQIERKSRQRQVIVYANLDGVPLGDAMAIVEGIADSEVPAGTTWSPEGNAKELADTLGNMLFALLLAIMCVYMILASQFESFVHPFTIMVSLPFALIGAFGGLILFDVPMSIFGMIGIIMLMGLVTKNAILLVDYTNQLREAGQGVRDALVNAGAVRLRPILMTTAAMVFGMLPVAIGHGDGGEARQPLGVIVIGGLISSTVLTLFVVPAVYQLVETIRGAALRLTRRAAAHGHAAEMGGADSLATAIQTVDG